MANSNRLAKQYLAELSKDKEQLLVQGFAPLLRYLEANAPLAERIGYAISPKQDVARFGQTPLLHFYPSAFTEIKQTKKTAEFRLKNSYWGMLGINGPLPTHLTEYAIERNYRLKDKTFTEFLDIFNHRFISLFYRAWADAEPTVSHDRPSNDRFKELLSTFSGSIQETKQAFSNDDHIEQYLTGLLSHKNRSASILIQTLSEYLQLPVHIQEFEGCWYTLEKNELSQLGKNNHTLAGGAMLGGRTYQRNFNFTITLGPMTYQQYIALINNQQQLLMVQKLTRKVVGQEFEFAICLALKAKQTQPCQLGVSRLGINSWSQDKSAHLTQYDPIKVYKKAC